MVESSRKMRSVATQRTSIGHFTILDVSKDLHIELDEPSSFLTTFHTPFGRYRWKHMPFGISSRGVSAKNAEGLQVVEVVADDFVTVGDSVEEAVQNHYNE